MGNTAANDDAANDSTMAMNVVVTATQIDQTYQSYVEPRDKKRPATHYELPTAGLVRVEL